MTRIARLVTIVCVVLGVAGFQVAAPRAATSLTVNDCTNDSGPGTLRTAVTQANADNAGDAITFGCSGTITLASTLFITGSMTVDGGGHNVVIDGGHTSASTGGVQMFSVSPGVSFGVSHLILQHGFNVSEFGGAIYNEGTLTVSSTTFSSNSASCTSNNAVGGAINDYRGKLTVTDSTFAGNGASCGFRESNVRGGAIVSREAPVTISDSTFTDNSVSCGGGCQSLVGGAIWARLGTLTIANSTFSGNTAAAGDGGAIYDELGALTVANSTLSGGTAIDGGAIYYAGGLVGNTLSVSDSTLSGNVALAGGGAILNESGTASISNSTLSLNTAVQTVGGAIDNGQLSGGGQAGGPVTITDSTLAANAALEMVGGEIANAAGGTVRIGGSIVAAQGARAGNCRGVESSSDLGYNLDNESPSGCGFSSANHDVVGSAPGFVVDASDHPVLTDNGGPTQTIALQSSSPAVDVIPTSYDIPGTTMPLCASADQRGAPRPDNGESDCEIGAYELQDKDATAPATTIELSPDEPSGRSDWYTGAVTVSVTASDVDDGASSLITRCALDPASAPAAFSDLPSGSCAYAVSGGASVASDGVHTLYAASEDPAGNAEATVRKVSFQIDRTPPAISDRSDSCSLPGTNGWCRGTETTTFSYLDATSGMASPCTAAPGNTCTQQISSAGDGSAVNLSSGTATDVAGNSAPAIASGPFRIDSTPPTVTCQSPAPTFPYGQAGARVSASDYDLTSGPQGGQPGATTTISAPASTSSVGDHSVPLTGYDNAGNTTTQSCPYTVTAANTATSLASSPNPSLQGQQVTFTATVSVNGPGNGAPTGTVTFTDGTATLGTSTLGASGNAANVATYSTSGLTPGSHTITAIYGGSSTLAGSASAALTQNVNPSGSSGGGGLVSVLAGSPFAPLTQNVNPSGSSGGGGLVSVRLVGSPTSTGNGVRFKLHCTGPAGQSCPTTDMLTTTETLKGGRPIAVSVAHKPKRGKHTVLTGSTRVTVGTGTTATLTITLNDPGRKLLNRFHKLAVTLTVELTSNGKTTVAAKHKLTIKHTKTTHHRLLHPPAR